MNECSNVFKKSAKGCYEWRNGITTNMSTSIMTMRGRRAAANTIIISMSTITMMTAAVVMSIIMNTSTIMSMNTITMTAAAADTSMGMRTRTTVVCC